jgi:predicted outer membrane repeat protein
VSKRQRRRQEKERRHGRAHARQLAAGAGLTVGATFAMGGVGHASDFTVDNTSDSTGTCPTPTTCSLRQAVGSANANGGPDNILFDSALSGTITLENGNLLITDHTYIEGPGAGQLTVNANNVSRVFSIATGGPVDPVSISGLTLTGGNAAGGGGVSNGDTALTISDAVVSGNTSTGNGGGIYSFGPSLTIERSTVSGNIATFSGAGVGGGINARYDLYMVDSTVRDNKARLGGGVYPRYSSDTMHRGPHTIRNSTIVDNTAYGRGGGVYFYGALDEADRLTIESSTIAGNDAIGSYGPGYGGGVRSSDYGYGYYGAILQNTIVAGNTAVGKDPDVSGDLINASFSLIQDPGTALITEDVAGSNIYAVDPQLGPLASNGGPTQTHALAPTSPAVDQGSSALAADQRGQPRPFDFATIANSSAAGADASDIGAFELQPSDIPAAAGGGGAAAVTIPPTCKGKTATILARPGLARTFNGTNKKDVIVGTTKKDTIKAKGGNDLVCAKGGKDTVKGGGGKDRLFGQGGKDTLKGGGGKDTLKGGGGKDILLGQGGKDRLVGGAKDDTCVGGAGEDTKKSC